MESKRKNGYQVPGKVALLVLLGLVPGTDIISIVFYWYHTNISIIYRYIICTQYYTSRSFYQEIICDLLNEGFLVYSIGNCLWDFFHRLFGLITHLKVFKKKIAEDSL